MILLDKGNVRIRKNLHDASRHLRLEDQDRSFWIDALSIDQNNLRERAQQIKIMGHIYRAADEIISWLGPAKDGSDFAMGVLDTEPELWAHDIGSLLPDETQAFVALYRRSYWGRVWILQEIYNARSFVVQCGSRSISGAKFFDRVPHIWNNLPLKQSVAMQESAAESIRYAKYYLPEAFHTLKFWISRCSGPGVKGSSVTASEPRDYIYALLGISADYCPDSTKEHTIAPDYDKPLLEVYLEAVAFCRKPLPTTTTNDNFSERFARKLGLKFDDIQHFEEVVAQRSGLEYDDYTHAHLKQAVLER